MKITVYERPDGTRGIRNHVLVIPTSICASTTAVRISREVPDTIALPHEHGCCQVGADFDQTVRTLAGLGRNPNVAAVLIVSLGCEGVPAFELRQRIAATGKPVTVVSIQEAGGCAKSVARGVEALAALKAAADVAPAVDGALSDLVVGLECGGSDATSGLAANPVVGVVADRLIGNGATCMLSETTELIGAEHVLARRARSPQVREALLKIVRRVEDRARAMGVDLRGSQPTPGNIEGGLTTIEEKSLGCIYKAGSRVLLEGVLEYGERPTGAGLYMMDTPGQDIESITGMVAGGAQLILFTTGRGTPTGCPVAPVIKITGNAETARRLADCIDVSVADVIDAGVSREDAAERLFAEILAVARGKQTRAERNGHHEFAINRVGPTF